MRPESYYRDAINSGKLDKMSEKKRDEFLTAMMKDSMISADERFRQRSPVLHAFRPLLTRVADETGFSDALFRASK